MQLTQWATVCISPSQGQHRAPADTTIRMWRGPMFLTRGPLAACSQGLATQFIELPINVSDAKVWEGIKLRYWQLDTYYLPIVQHDDDSNADEQHHDSADEGHPANVAHDTDKAQRQAQSDEGTSEPV